MEKILMYGLEDLAINGLIYALASVPLFLIFWVCYRSYFQVRRIQAVKRSNPKMIRHEIRYSLLTLMIFAFIDVGLYFSQQCGITQLYTKVSDYGLPYFLFSIILMILLHDAWFYWTHRLMHHPRLFKYIHKVHHKSVDPSPFAAFSFHPLEALVEAGIYVFFAFSFPVHLLALLSWQIIQMGLNVIGHLGYEIYPSGFNRHWLFQWKTPSTHHNLHHSRFNGNYGLYFTWWDKWFNTEIKDYHHVYEHIQTRIKNKGSLALLILLLSSSAGMAQGQILGKWLSEDKEGITEIYEQGGKYFGKISWLKTPNDRQGLPFTDTENSNPSLRARPLLGLELLKHFEFIEQKWKNGTIYDPETGKTYQCTLWLEGADVLKVRGYWGLFFQTQTWKRTR